MPDSFVEQSKVRLREGDMVFRKGDMAEQMFVLLSGKVRFYLGDSPSGGWSEEFTKGDCFGEASLLDAQPRHATAVAMEDTELIAVSRGTFMRMIRQSPEISVKMMQRLTQRNRDLTVRLDRAESGAPARFAAQDGQICFISASDGREYPMESPSVLIGRFDAATGIHPDIDLTAEANYLSVSRRHARVFMEHGRYFIMEEKGVANGTFVQGERLEQDEARELSYGNRVGIGAVVLVVNKA
jgi:CRP-like cAMP-binding protein